MGLFFLFFFCFVFLSLRIPLPAVIQYILSVWRCCAVSLNLMKKTLERTPPDSASQSVWETHKEWHAAILEKNSNWDSHEKYLCMLNFLVSTGKFSLSLLDKQMRGEFSREWLRVIWFLRAIEGKPKINTDFPRDNRFWWTLRMIYSADFQWSVDSHWSNNTVRLLYSCLEEITHISQYFNFYILAEVLPKSYDCIHSK